MEKYSGPKYYYSGADYPEPMPLETQSHCQCAGQSQMIKIKRRKERRQRKRQEKQDVLFEDKEKYKGTENFMAKVLAKR